MVLEGLDHGLVFEDDPVSRTGYLYLTTPDHAAVLDALHLYDYEDADKLLPGEPAFVVWSASLGRAGFHFHGRFQAGVDFRARRAGCRSGLPMAVASDWSPSHRWSDDLVSGLEP